MANPCYRCQRRHTRCHVDCTDYEAFRAERDAENERRRAEVSSENDFQHMKKNLRKIAERYEK